MEEKPEDHKDNYVDWDVRCEYEMIQESRERDGVKYFVLFYKVYTYNIQTAWELAMQAFPMKINVGNRVYGRQVMRVAIDS